MLAFVFTHKFEFRRNSYLVFPILTRYFISYDLLFLLFILCLLNSLKIINYTLSIIITNLGTCWINLYSLLYRIKSTLIEFSFKIILSRNIKFFFFLFQPTLIPINNIILIICEIFRKI